LIAAGSPFSRLYPQAAGAEILREAVRVEPDYARAHWNLGLLLVQLGVVAQALPHFEHALTIPLAHSGDQPKLISSHIQLAGILARDGRTADARSHLRQALDLDPRQPTAYVQLGVLALRQKRALLAIQHFEAALAIDAEHPVAAWNLERARTLRDTQRSIREVRSVPNEPGAPA